ncbi:MAG: hypothetical protein IK132_10960 [Clostridia bacterium]|nr:hypothetical protein [Clostridia bacterium]
MVSKKCAAIVFAFLLIISLSACTLLQEVSGNTETENHASSLSGKSEDSIKKIEIEQIEFTVDNEIYNGERKAFMQCTNNSPFTIYNIEISFIQKADVSEEQLEQYYADLIEYFESDLSEEDYEELRQRKISMYAMSKRIIPSGKTINKIDLYYYSSYYYMRNLSHYDLVEPDIATIQYVMNGKIYTEYYDFQSKKYSFEEDAEEAYTWGKISPLAELVTKPDVEICKIEYDRDDLFGFCAFGCSSDDYKAYVEDCRSRGFTIEADDFGDSYYAYDVNENRISVYYDEDHGSIEVDVHIKDSD